MKKNVAYKKIRHLAPLSLTVWRFFIFMKYTSFGSMMLIYLWRYGQYIDFGLIELARSTSTAAVVFGIAVSVYAVTKVATDIFIIVHECIHFFTLRLCGGKADMTVKKNGNRVEGEVRISSNQKITRGTYALMAIAPLMILSPPALVMVLLSPNEIVFAFGMALFVINTAGSSKDIIDTRWALSMPKGSYIQFESGSSHTVYAPVK